MKNWHNPALYAVIVVGVLAHLSGFTAYADAPKAPPANTFAITTSGQNPIMAWRINTNTGAVSVCFSSDPNSAPRCAPWSTD